MDRLRPPRPALKFGEKGLVLIHTPPTYASHVALYLHDADGKKRFLDADKNKFLAPGETGSALSVSVRGGHPQEVLIDDVGGAGEFSSTVCYRSPNGFAWSPESLRSDTIILALPAAPCAPLLEPYTRSTVKVTVAAPAFCSRISIKAESQTGSTYRVAPQYPIKLDPGGVLRCTVALVAEREDGQFDAAPGAMALGRLIAQGAFSVPLPLRDAEYAVSVAAFNGAGWSPFGPVAKIRIADHAPLAPAAPTLTKIREDGVDVHFTRPPAPNSMLAPPAPRMMVSVRADDITEDLFYDEKQDRLIGKVDAGFNVGNCYLRGLHCAIGGLDPGTDYEVKVWTLNAFGASPSPGASFKTLPSEVEVTGVKSAEERDAELKRQAVDVDVDDDDAPETKRPRPDVHTGLLGIETSLRCPISTGLLVNPLKARPCGHVYSKASAMAYFKGVGKRCAVFGCDKHLKWSDFVVDEASEHALREYYRRQARTRQDADGHPYGQLM